MANKAVKESRDNLHADFPALDGPMSRILRVGRESSEAMIKEQEILNNKAKSGEVYVDCHKKLRWPCF